MPEDWERCVAVIAYTFHFPPSELWALDIDDITFWVEQAEELNKAASGAS